MATLNCGWGFLVLGIKLLLIADVCLAAEHPELRGQLPDQADIDDGQCVPIRCELGVPPAHCADLCAQRSFNTVCQPPGDFCLCHRILHGQEELVSPDEVLEQPDESSLGFIRFFAVIVPSSSLSLEVQDDQPITVDVHSGRLFWLFHGVLLALLLLMFSLLLYELIMCLRRDCDQEKYNILQA